MKRILKWTGLVLLTPVVLFILIPVLLYLPPVQNWAVDKVASIASEKTGMHISVGHVALAFPLDLSVDEVMVVREQDTIAHIGNAVVDVKLLPLLKKQVVVNQLEINEASMNTLDFISDLQIKGHVGQLSVASRSIDLNVGTVDLNNAQLKKADLTILLSDTAAVDTTTTETPWLINVDSLTIDRSRVEVHILSTGSAQVPGDTMQVEAYMGSAKVKEGVIDLLNSRYTVGSLDCREGTLDTGDIALTGIGIGVDSISYQAPDLSLKIRDAAMREKSGLELSELQATVRMDSTTLYLPQLNLRTPYSYVCARGQTDLNVMDSVAPGHFDISLDASLGRQDMMLLLAEQPQKLRDKWPEWPLTVKAQAAGTMEKASVKQLKVTLPTVFHAEANGTIGLQGTTTASLDIKAESYDTSLLAAYVPGLGKDYLLPKGMTLQGSINSNGPVMGADLTMRDGKATAKLRGHLNQQSMSYDADVTVSDLNVSRYLPKQNIGTVSATATAKGRGTDFLDKSSWIEADVNIQQLQYDHYNLESTQLTAKLSNGHATATATGRNPLFEGSIDVDALLDKKNIEAKISTDLKRIDMHAIGLSENLLTGGATGKVELRTNMKEQHYVKAYFNNLYISDSAKTFHPEAIGVLFRSNRDTTLARIQSGNFIVKADAKGGYEQVLKQCTVLADSMMAQYHNRTIDQPLLKRLLPTGRLYIESGNENPIADILRVSKNIAFKEFLLDMTTSPEQGVNALSHIYGLNADSTLIDTLRLNLVEKAHGLTFNGDVVNGKKNPQFVFRALFDGRLQEHGASIGLRLYDGDEKMGLRIGAQAMMVDEGLNLHLIPKDPTIGYKKFKLNDNNYVLLQRNKRIKAKVDLVSDDGTGVKVYSTESEDSTLLQDLTVSLHRIDLGQICEVLPYLPRITGQLNGDYHLTTNPQGQVSVASDMEIQQMTYEGSRLGNISTEMVYLQREDNTHAVEGILMLEDTEVGSLRGEYRNTENGHLDATMKLTRFPLDMVNGFIQDQIIGFDGFAGGELSVKGTLRKLDVDGIVKLQSAALISAPYGVRLRFDEDTVRISDAKLLLNDFKMYAYNDKPLTMTGNIDFHDTEHITMDMRLRAEDFQIINSKQTSKSVAWGKAFVNVIARMNGPLDQLNMRGRLNVLGSTDLNYILLDSPLSTDNQMDELVKFTNFNDSVVATVSKPAPNGLNADLTINIDQGAHVKCALNVDQTNYVDLFGGGDLRMKYSGEGITMNGRYTISNGEMKYSLPVIPLKTFTIKDGSFVEFTGDPTNPRLNLTATERVYASVGQEGTQSRSVAFDCGVIITKTLNNMGLEFIISAPEDNSIDNELSAMGTEERGKIAVTMLTTGMYLVDGNTSGFTMNAALSSFLQNEINNITGSALKTLDLSIGLDNTTDASGKMRTDYSFKFAKRFWNNRLKVQIGGKVSSGQDAMEEGKNKSFFDNVSMEYRLSPTGNQYVNLFYSQNVYDWLDGYTSEYGGGYLWRRKLDTLWDLFKFKSDNQQTPERRMITPRPFTATDSIQSVRTIVTDSIKKGGTP